MCEERNQKGERTMLTRAVLCGTVAVAENFFEFGRKSIENMERESCSESAT